MEIDPQLLKLIQNDSNFNKQFFSSLIEDETILLSNDNQIIETAFVVVESPQKENSIENNINSHYSIQMNELNQLNQLNQLNELNETNYLNKIELNTSFYLNNENNENHENETNQNCNCLLCTNELRMFRNITWNTILIIVFYIFKQQYPNENYFHSSKVVIPFIQNHLNIIRKYKRCTKNETKFAKLIRDTMNHSKYFINGYTILGKNGYYKCIFNKNPYDCVEFFNSLKSSTEMKDMKKKERKLKQKKVASKSNDDLNQSNENYQRMKQHLSVHLFSNELKFVQAINLNPLVNDSN